MADNNNQQRSSTSLFGSSAGASRSVQEIMREHEEATRARRKWLFSWLLPLLAVIVVGGVGTIATLQWMAYKKSQVEKQRAEEAANDPMRGVTVYGNEDAELKLRFETEDMIIAPTDVLTVLHRAVGVKPFKVRLDTVNMQARGVEGDSLDPIPTRVAINGKFEVEYLDENGERKLITLVYPKMTLEQLISAITLAYHDTYGDDDPEHPFHIEPPKPVEHRHRKHEETIDLKVDKLNPRK